MAYWDKITERGNIEDRRGMAPVVGGISLTGVALLLLVNYLNGGTVTDALQQVGRVVLEQQTQQLQSTQDSGKYAGQDSYEVFASAVLGSNNATWTSKLQAINVSYTAPKLVLFREATKSGCGVATAEVGPHYCSLDHTIYLDETFFDEMNKRFGARIMDVGQAYVISHEVGHHIQNLLGEMQRLEAGANTTSVKMELQADCFAGIWVNSLKGRGVFEVNEVQEAIDAASDVGDDRIQEKVQGYVNPETFTHGSAEDRKKWFVTGYDKGSIDACDTFR